MLQAAKACGRCSLRLKSFGTTNIHFHLYYGNHMLNDTNHHKARGERHGNCNLNLQLAACQIALIVNKGGAHVLVRAKVQSPLREHLVDGTAYHQADKRHGSCAQQAMNESHFSHFVHHHVNNGLHLENMYSTHVSVMSPCHETMDAMKC